MAKPRFQTIICQVFFFFFYLLLNPIRIQSRRAVNYKCLICQVNKRFATKTMSLGLFRMWLLIVYISSAGKWQLASLFLISTLLILKKICWVLKGLAWGAFKLICVDLRIESDKKKWINGRCKTAFFGSVTKFTVLLRLINAQWLSHRNCQSFVFYRSSVICFV